MKEFTDKQITDALRFRCTPNFRFFWKTFPEYAAKGSEPDLQAVVTLLRKNAPYALYRAAVQRGIDLSRVTVLIPKDRPINESAMWAALMKIERAKNQQPK